MTRISAILLALVLPIFAWAQLVPLPDFDAWDQQAEASIQALEKGNATPIELKKYRAELVDQREQATKYANDHQILIKPVRDQLDALPKKTENVDEDPFITQRREALTKQLGKVEVPVLTANQAVARANAIIAQIDETSRRRTYDALFSRQGSPLDPRIIFQSVEDFTKMIGMLFEEFGAQFSEIINGSKSLSHVWLSLFGFVLGVIFLFIIPRELLQNFSRKKSTLHISRNIRSFLPIITFALFVPLGLFLIYQTMMNLGLLGPLGLKFTQTIAVCALLATPMMWVGTLASRQKKEDRKLRWPILALSVLVGLDIMLPFLLQNGLSKNNTSVILYHFLIVLASIPLVWQLTYPALYTALFGQLDHGEMANSLKVMRNAYRLGMAMALVLSVIGFLASSYRIYLGLNLSMGIILVAYWLYERSVNFIAIVMRKIDPEKVNLKAEHQASIWPIIFGIGIAILTIPLLLLAWGVAANNLSEIYNSVSQGFSVGGVNVSLGLLFKMILVFLFGYFLVRVLQRLLRTTILPRTPLDVGSQTAIVSLTGYVGITLAVLVAVDAAGINLSSITMIASALSVGLGFGLQNIVQNFVSGLILLIERPIKKNDYIIVGDYDGFVRNIAVRATEIETKDGESLIVPNSELVSKNVINWEHSNRHARVHVKLGVSYDSDPEQVEKLLLEAVQNNPFRVDIKEPSVRFKGFSDFGMLFDVRYYIRPAHKINHSRSESYFEIVKLFNKHGIEIAFPESSATLPGGGAQTAKDS